MPTIDPNLGRLTWNPGIPQIGTYPITVVVTNSGGLQATQSYNLIVAADTQAPTVIIRTAPAGQVGMGQSFTVQVKATDNVGVTSLTLTATFGGVTTPIALLPDANGGTATLSYPTAGLVTLNASASDAAGNVGTASTNVLVVNPAVTLAPVATIASPSDQANLTAPVPVIGTVSDPSNALVSWTLSIAPDTDGELGDEGGTSPPTNTTPTTLATGTTPVVNGTLGTLDTTLLANGSYTLTLTALNAGGLTSSSSIDVELSKNLKLGALNLSFTDMTVPAAGIPITITRNYSSLDANQQGDFGYGWTLSMSNTKVQVHHQDNDLSDFGDYVPMEDGDRVYVTLPDGTREGFTFEAQPDQGFGGPTGNIVVFDWVPYFIPDAGVPDQLFVNNVDLTQVGNEFVNEATGDSYNPALPEFGNSYTLQMHNGTQLAINATTGQLSSIADMNGNTVNFTGMGIESSSGQYVQFTRDAAGRITSITSSGGQTVSYEYDSNGNLIAFTDADGNTTAFTYLSSPAHYLNQIIGPDGNPVAETQYNSSGRISAVTNAAGQTATYTYNVSGKSTTVTDPLGNSTTTTYDDDGNAIKVVNALGGVTLNTYDSNDDLLSTTVETSEGPLTTTYTYDQFSDVTSTTNPDGTTTYATYNSFGQVLSQTDALGNVTSYEYDDNGNLLSSFDPQAGETTYTYDANGNMTSSTDPLGNTTSYRYNGAGNVISETDPTGVTTTFTYDVNGNQTGTAYNWVNPNNSADVIPVTTSTTYDADGNALSQTDPEGNTTTTTYTPDGQIASTTDEYGHTTQYLYNVDGDLIQTTYWNGTVSQTVYDAHDRPTYTTDQHVPGQLADGTYTAYDGLGDVTLTQRVSDVVIDITTDPQGNSSSQLQSAGAVLSSTSSVYDDTGRVVSTTDPDGLTTNYEYNSLGQQIAISETDGTTTRTTQYEFDQYGRQVAVIDPLGNVTRTVYDQFSQAVETIYPDRSTNKTAYDSSGDVISQTDELGQTTQYRYDSLGQLIAVIEPAVINPATGQLTHPEYTYTYDTYGDQTSITSPNGGVTHFTYDQFGNELSRTLPDGQAQTFEYDRYGRQIQKVDFEGDIIDSVYSDTGLLAELDYYAPGQTPSSDAPAQMTTYQYNALGQEAQVTDSEGTTDYTYNLEGEVTQVATAQGILNYEYDADKHVVDTFTSTSNTPNTPVDDFQDTYDAFGDLTSVAVFERNGVELATPETTTYQYNTDAQLTEQTAPNGVVTAYTYDSVGNETSLTDTAPNGEPIDAYDYTYRADGLQTGVTETIWQNGTPDVTTTSWTYDALDRLTKEVYDSYDSSLSYTTTYTYDLDGNRVGEQQSTSTGTETTLDTYDTDDRLISEVQTSSTSQGTTTTYQYGGPGNSGTEQTMVTVTNTQTGQLMDQQSYTYNLQGLTSGVVIAEYDSSGNVAQQDTVTYAYNASGDRVGETDEVQTASAGSPGTLSTQSDLSKTFLVDENNPTGYSQVLEEVDRNAGSGALVNDLVFTLGLQVLTQASVTPGSQSAGTPLFLFYDSHGSTRLVLDGSLNVQGYYRYDAYGNPIGFDPATAVTTILYAGQSIDPLTGQYDNRARDYDPATGTFTSLDPYAGNMQAPQSLNTYAYAQSDPINGIDPTGLFDQQFGYDVEKAIQPIYMKDHPGQNWTFGNWTRLGGGAFRLKPDIQNWTTRRWAEIKPLTLSGIARAVTALALYSSTLGALGKGWLPDAKWKPSENKAMVDGVMIGFFNAGGIIFYTDMLENLQEFVALTSIAAVREVYRNLASQRMIQGLQSATYRAAQFSTASEGTEITAAVPPAELNTELGGGAG